jgi:hypothetical protein
MSTDIFTVTIWEERLISRIHTLLQENNETTQVTFLDKEVTIENGIITTSLVQHGDDWKDNQWQAALKTGQPWNPCQDSYTYGSLACHEAYCDCGHECPAKYLELSENIEDISIMTRDWIAEKLNQRGSQSQT